MAVFIHFLLSIFGISSMSTILFSLGIGCAAIYYWDDHPVFSILLILVVITGQIYNLLLKNVAFADIISLSTIYIWRALAGCAIIGVRISPWLTITIFLVAMFLASGKRIADLEFLGKVDALKHKKSYDEYSTKLLDYIIVMIATSLFVTFTLYCVLGPMEAGSIVPLENQGLLIFTAPVALYMIIRFLYLLRAKPEMVRQVEKLIKDISMVIAAVILAIMIILILYVENELVNGFF